MLMTILIIINIGVIAYFGTIFVRLHEDLQFMNDDIVFNREQEEGGPLKYSEIEGQEKRIFDRMEIHFIKTLF